MPKAAKPKAALAGKKPASAKKNPRFRKTSAKKEIPVRKKLPGKKISPRSAAQPPDLAKLAGKSLHDDVGPLLAAVGLRLQLLRMDQPATEERIDYALDLLDTAMERVRALSQMLSPSPLASNVGRSPNDAISTGPFAAVLAALSPAAPPASASSAVRPARKRRS